MELCKSGRVRDGMQLVKSMVDDNIELSHFTLSALLRGCIEDKRYLKQYQSVWTRLVNDWGIAPNHVSYVMAITAASHCHDVTAMNAFKEGLWRECSPSILDQWHWNELMAAFGRCSDIDAMLTVFDAMKHCNAEFGDQYTMSIVLNALIRSMRSDPEGVHRHFDRFCADLVDFCNFLYFFILGLVCCSVALSVC